MCDDFHEQLLDKEIDYAAIDKVMALRRADAQNYIQRVLQAKAGG